MSEDSLDPLITQCPQCDTQFRVTEEQLQVANGRVRCGACLLVFDGTARLVVDGELVSASDVDPDVDALLAELDDIDLPLEADLDAQSGVAAEEQGDNSDLAALDALEAALLAELKGEESHTDQLAGLEELPLQEVVAEPAPDMPWQATPPPTVQPEESIELVAVADSTPLESNTTRAPEVEEELPEEFLPYAKDEQRSRLATVLIWIALLTLPIQVLWFQFDSWAKSPSMRPFYAAVCAGLGCELPVRIDVERIEAQNSVLRKHPERADGLIYDVLMINHAAYPQPFPLVELTMTNLDGNLVAGRRFQPEEYLAEEFHTQMMAPRTPLHISLEMHDPGHAPLNYQIRFLPDPRFE